MISPEDRAPAAHDAEIPSLDPTTGELDDYPARTFQQFLGIFDLLYAGQTGANSRDDGRSKAANVITLDESLPTPSDNVSCDG